MLTIQSVCSAQNIKIPWGEVAKEMGHETTEGAIVQHLSKLRARRVHANKPVPKPLKRGYGGSSNRASDLPVAKRSKFSETPKLENNDETSDGEWIDDTSPPAKHKAGSRRRKRKPQYNGVPDEEYEEESVESDEMLVPGASFLTLPNDAQQMEAEASPSLEPTSKLVTFSGPITKRALQRFQIEQIEQLEQLKKLEDQQAMYEDSAIFADNIHQLISATSFVEAAAMPATQTFPSGAVHNELTTHTNYPPPGPDTQYISNDPDLSLPNFELLDAPLSFDVSDQLLYQNLGPYSNTMDSEEQSYQEMLGMYTHFDDSSWRDDDLKQGC
ncbi:hypothetical protein BJX99DRAFT_7303 [Aspergillus californicus]